MILGHRTLSDATLIDAIEAKTPQAWVGDAWRVCRQGRDPLACSSSRARWDDGGMDVLYTATSFEGAVEEMRFHLGRGQPVIPDLPVYEIFRLQVSLENVLDISSANDIKELGVDISGFGRMPNLSHETEYVRSQEIAAAAHFLDFHGIGVPSARSESSNLVVFCDKAPPGAVSVVENLGPISVVA